GTQHMMAMVGALLLSASSRRKVENFSYIRMTAFSGRVSSGTWPRMTIRSKQWYTKASRLPNNRTKSSIGPLAPLRFVSQQEHRTGDRWRSKKFQIFLLRFRLSLFGFSPNAGYCCNHIPFPSERGLI